MTHKRFTISAYYDHEGIYNEETMEQVKPLDGYDTLQDCLKWCEQYEVCISMVSVTEWDLNSIDAYGIPDIVTSVLLDAVVADHIDDLSQMNDLSMYQI